MELLILIVALVLMISFHHCQAFVPPSVISHYKHHRQVFNLFMSTIDAIEMEVSSMRVKQIKDELESYGISTRTFLEKGELVEALVRARKDGKKAVVASSTSSSSSNDSTKKSKKKKRRSINDDNVEEEVKAKVEVITSDNVGPKTKKSRDSSQQGSSSNPFGGGGGGSPFGGMGGMDIGDILKNMGGAGMGGAAGANPFGGMGGGDAMKGMLCCDAFIS